MKNLRKFTLLFVLAVAWSIANRQSPIGNLSAQPAPVLADPTTGALLRPSAANLRTGLGVGTGDTPSFTGATVTGNTHTSAGQANKIAAWGDSMTFGLYVKLAYASGYYVYNGGVGGESSTQIKTRMLADTAKHTWPTVIWAGRNNFASGATVLADIAEMVAALTAAGNTRYLIVSVFNGSTEESGSAGYNQIIAINNSLSSTYGAHYVDARATVVAAYDPGTPQDVTDHGHDVPPSTLRYDTIHLNSAGYIVVANALVAQIATLTDRSSAAVLSQNNISDLFAAMPYRAYQQLYVGTPPVGGPFTNSLVASDAFFLDLVGIGTQTPAAPLDIGGRLQVSLLGDVSFLESAQVTAHVYASSGSLNLKNQTVDVFQGNGGSAIANGMPKLPRGVVIAPLNADYPSMVVTGDTGWGTVSAPQTTLHLVGANAIANVAGDTTYHGGGKQHFYSIFGDAYGNGSSYSAGTPNTTDNTYKGGRAGAYLHGGDGHNFAGGGAGVVAIGGSTVQSVGTAEGGAGIYAKGGLNGNGSTYAWAGYFDGSLYATTLSLGGKALTLGGNFTTSGAHATTFTTSGTTTLTLPTSGTLQTAQTSAAGYGITNGAALDSFAAAQSGTAQNLTTGASPSFVGGTFSGNVLMNGGEFILNRASTSADHRLTFKTAGAYKWAVGFYGGTSDFEVVNEATGQRPLRIDETSGDITFSSTTEASAGAGSINTLGGIYAAKKIITSSDVEIADVGDGVIIKSPDGTRWRITVSNAGAIVVTGL